MSGDAGEARDMAYRLADALLTGSGVMKAAGGAYVAQREAYARAWFPFADVMVNRGREIADRMDENLQKMRAIYEQDQARKAAQAQAFQVTIPEPQMVPLDLEQMMLRATLGARGEPPHANGHDLSGGGT